MKLVDVNVLLYALDKDSARHREARAWLESALSSGETVGLSWTVLLAFVRLSTKRQLFDQPLSADEALDLVEEWLALPNVVTVHPGPQHARALRDLLAGAGTGGNLVTDAHLAALALETGAEVCSFDDDFRRFPRVRWTVPH